jgi:ketosteroid isomerase-like protein
VQPGLRRIIAPVPSPRVEAIERFYAAFNREGGVDWDAVRDLLTADAEWYGGMFGDRLGVGVDGWRAVWDAQSDAWNMDKSRDEIDEVFEVGSCVVVDSHGYDVGRASGILVESRRGMVFEFDDGRIKRWRVHPTVEEALAAARATASPETP